MKRFLSVLLVLVLSVSCACAEGDKDSIESFLSNKWNGFSQFAENTWNNVSQWANGAWGDASKWVEQAWDDSSKWVTDIWGDASTWAIETYESASDAITAWWVDTFISVTSNADNKWNWIVEEKDSLSAEAQNYLSKIREVSSDSKDVTEEEIKSIFDCLLEKLDLNEIDRQKVWDTAKAYANHKGLSELATEKLMLPYLFKLVVDSTEADDSIPAIALAQYLTGIVEKLNVNSEDAANKLILQLNEALGTI